jgi:protein-S-isoprenylcysteine O-methyltransferase Ste14
MNFDPAYAIQLPWLIFLGYWIFAATRVNKMERREPDGTMLARIFVTVAGWYLLSRNEPWFGVLNRRFMPWSPPAFVAAAVLTWAGIAFAIWARYHIAQYWSASVALRADHQLIRTGPYAHIRHPIYTGMLLAIVGTALAVGRFRALLAFAIILAALVFKSRQEERLLASQFGPAFDEHRRRTGFFLPRLS